MKKILKNIIIYTSVIYFILCMIYSIFLKEELKYSILNLKRQDEITSLYGQTTEQTMNQEWISFREGQIYILEDNLKYAITAIVIGTFIAILLSSKDNSIVKYILFFILGAIGYNLIWTTIICMINFGIGNKWIHFLEVFEKPSLKIIISYIPIYIALFLAYIEHKKKQVKELNDTLKDKSKEIKKININIKLVKKIAIIILAIVVIAIIVIGRNLIYKINVINTYCLKNEELQLKQNYYIKKTYKSYDNQIKSIDEIFFKDGKMIQYLNQKPTNYADSNTGKQDFRNVLYPLGVYNYWSNIKLALDVKINSTKINGHNCYKIEYGDMHNYYIEKETGLILRTEQIVKDDENATMSTDYEYSFGTVTDEQVSKDILLKYVEEQKSME